MIISLFVWFPEGLAQTDKASPADSLTAKLLVDLKTEWNNFRMDSALRIARNGFLYSDNSNDNYGAADFAAWLARIHSFTGFSDSSVFYSLKSLDIGKKVSNEKAELEAVISIMEEYNKVGMADKGIQLGKLYGERIEICRDTGLLIRYYTVNGSCFTSQGDSESAGRCFNHALRLSREHGNLHTAKVLFHQSELIKIKGDFRLAEKTLLESLSYTGTEDAGLVAEIHIRLGRMMSEESGKEDSSLYYFGKGIEASRQYGYTAGEGLMNKYMGMSWFRRQDFNRALPFLENASEQLYGAINPGEIIPVWKMLVTIYEAKGDKKKAYESLRYALIASEQYSPGYQKERLTKLGFSENIRMMGIDKQELEGSLKLLSRFSGRQQIFIGLLITLSVILFIVYSVLKKRKKVLTARLSELSDLSAQIQPAPVMQAPVEAAEPTGQGDVTSGNGRHQIREETFLMIRQRLEEWIREKGFTERITINEVAIKLHTNPKYLSEVIAKEYGCANFSEFLNKMRIDYLLFLLRNDASSPDHTVEYLAGLLGYGSRTTFIKAFKEQTGFNPLQYLKQVRKRYASGASGP